MDSVLERRGRLMEKRGINFEVCDVCSGDGMDADSLLYRVTMHVMKLRAHFPQFLFHLKYVLCLRTFASLCFVYTTLSVTHLKENFSDIINVTLIQNKTPLQCLCSICRKGFSLFFVKKTIWNQPMLNSRGFLNCVAPKNRRRQTGGKDTVRYKWQLGIKSLSSNLCKNIHSFSDS